MGPVYACACRRKQVLDARNNATQIRSYERVSLSICYLKSFVSHEFSPHHPIMPSASSAEELFAEEYFTTHPSKSWNRGRFFQHCRRFSGHHLSDRVITNLYRRCLFRRKDISSHARALYYLVSVPACFLSQPIGHVSMHPIGILYVAQVNGHAFVPRVTESGILYVA